MSQSPEVVSLKLQHIPLAKDDQSVVLHLPWVASRPSRWKFSCFGSFWPGLPWIAALRLSVVIEDFAGFLLEDWLLLLSRHLLILPIFLVLAAVVYGSLASIITTARGKFTRPAFFRGTLPRNCQHSSWQNRYLVAFGWEAAKGGQVRFQCRAERVCVRKDCCAA